MGLSGISCKDLFRVPNMREIQVLRLLRRAWQSSNTFWDSTLHGGMILVYKFLHSWFVWSCRLFRLSCFTATVLPLNSTWWVANTIAFSSKTMKRDEVVPQSIWENGIGVAQILSEKEWRTKQIKSPLMLSGRIFKALEIKHFLDMAYDIDAFATSNGTYDWMSSGRPPILAPALDLRLLRLSQTAASTSTPHAESMRSRMLTSTTSSITDRSTMFSMSGRL